MNSSCNKMTGIEAYHVLELPLQHFVGANKKALKTVELAREQQNLNPK